MSQKSNCNTCKYQDDSPNSSLYNNIFVVCKVLYTRERGVPPVVRRIVQRNADLILGERRSPWPDNKPSFVEHLVFVGHQMYLSALVSQMLNVYNCVTDVIGSHLCHRCYMSTLVSQMLYVHTCVTRC